MLSRFFDFVSSQPRLAVLLLVLIIAMFVWATLWIVLRCMLCYRKMTNAERLQMIESGQAVELLKTLETQARRNRFFSVALALAFWVPGISILGATYSTVRTEGDFGTSLVAWIAAIIVSLASTVCATLVMGRQQQHEKGT